MQRVNHLRPPGLGRGRTSARLLLAVLAVVVLQPLAATPAAARQQPKLPEARGLGPRPGPNPTGDCRDPMPDPGQLCLQSSVGTGKLSISPHVVQACKKSLLSSCPKITATFSPIDGAVIWDGAFKTCAPFSYSPAPDVQPGKHGGPTSCTLEATGPTSGWTTASVHIYGPCGSINAVRQGLATEANCDRTFANDYYAILPEGVGIIDGTITEKDGKTPIRGIAVQVRSADNKRSVAYTDSTGYYSAYVDEGDYTICPCKFKDDSLNGGAPDTFTPRSPNLHVKGNVTQDFVEGGWNIAGKVSRKVQRKGDPVLSGITISISGKDGFFREATTDEAGAYSITVPEGWYVVESQTPPMVRPGEFINGAPWECRNGGAAGGAAACVVELTRDKTVDFVMDNQYKLKLTEASKPALPGRKAQRITARVTDSRGNPVAGKKVHFSPTTPPGAKVILGSPDGRKLYSSAPRTDGKVGPTDFELPTDWSGQAVLYKWSQAAGGLAIKAALDNSTDKSQDLSTYPGEEATLDDNPTFPAVGPPLPADIGDILEKLVHGRLGARPAPASSNANLQFNVVNSLNGLAEPPADFEPVRTADDATGGVIVYPRFTDDKAITAIEAFLADPNLSPQTSPAVSGALVIDLDEVGKLVRDSTSNRIIPSKLTPLATWAKAHPKSIAGNLDRTDEVGIRSGIVGRGYPTTPSVQKRQPADSAIGATNTGTVIRTRGKVAIMATATTNPPPASPGIPSTPIVGKKAGLDASRQIVMELPGAEVLNYAKIPATVKLLSFGIGTPQAADAGGDSEEVVYYLPAGVGYDVEVVGGGSGKATVTLVGGTNGSNVEAFSLDVTPGRTGTFKIGAEGSAAERLTFGGKSVTADAGPRLKLGGLPARVTSGVAETHSVKVTNDFGEPIAGARVDIGNKTYGQSEWTGPDGTVSITVKAGGAEDLAATASAYAYTEVTQKIRLDPPPRGPSVKARAAAANLPASPLVTLKQVFDPLLVLIVAGLILLLVAALGVVRRQKQFLRVVDE